MELEKLTEKQAQYLEERGFAVVDGKPPVNERFPYLTLREPQKWIEQSECTYHATPSSHTGTMGVGHPSTLPTAKLVSLIEYIVATNMVYDGELFKTKPGQPIKIFVMDHAWDEVAKTVVTKYTQNIKCPTSQTG